MTYIDNNPKTAFGSAKPSITKVPPASLIYQALGMMNGAKKYGPYNWRENEVTASIYVDAAMRHLLAWFDGEAIAQDSGVPHLAHAIASLGIIIDALETGNLIDDRPLKGAAAELLARYTNQPCVPCTPAVPTKAPQTDAATSFVGALPAGVAVTYTGFDPIDFEPVHDMGSSP